MSSNEISQDQFPGAWIEPKWSLPEKIELAPFYAIRIAFGAQVIESPRGMPGFVSVMFEGTEYVLHKDNYNDCKKLTPVFKNSFLTSRGYNTGDNSHLRFEPEVVINGLKFLFEAAREENKLPENLTKMIWMVPDQGPCGYYRSMLPFRYMQKNFADTFYCESHNFLNTNTLKWFDAAIMHRYPPNALLAIFQGLSISNKTMVYEYDDDIFNVPAWNVNSKNITQETIDRARAALKCSDVVLASTSPLVDISEKDDAMHCPNLIDMNDIGEPLKCDRKVVPSLFGYHPTYTNKGKVVFKCPGKKDLQESDTRDSYNPVRILWTGSNTHDHDLEIAAKAIKEVIKKYGIAVRFFMFGYCPPEFLTAVVSSGNSEMEYMVKQEYNHCLSYFPPVNMQKYYNSIRTIDPDIAICPLTDHVFNLSKSNLKVLEMSAFGIPCIASNVGPYRFLETDEGQHGQSGVLVDDSGESGNPVVRWVQAISGMIDLVTQRVIIGENARRMVYDRYSWNTDSENRRKWDAAFNRINEISQSRKIENGTEAAST